MKRIAIAIIFSIPICGNALNAVETTALDAKGIVTNHLGKPLASATVELARQKYTPHTTQVVGIDVLASATSSADGSFNLSGTIPAEARRACILRATAPGCAYSTLRMDLDANEDERYFDLWRYARSRKPWLILLPAHIVRGVVVDEQDKGISGCEISTDGSCDPIRSGADGKFEITFPDFGQSMFLDRSFVAFSHADFVGRSFDAYSVTRDVQQEDGSWRVSLVPGVRINGKIVDDLTDKPLAGAAVKLMGYVTPTMRMTYTAWTDEQGHFTARVPANVKITLMPLRPDEQSELRDYFPAEERRELKFEGDTTDVNFAFRKGQTISGQLKLKGEADITSLAVQAKSPDGSQQLSFGKCDSDGRFVIHALPAGRCRLDVVQDRGNALPLLATQDAEIPDGANLGNVEITVEMADAPALLPKVHGKVINPDGTPAVLVAFRSIPSGIQRIAFSDLDGNFACSFVNPEAAKSFWACDAARDNAAAFVFPTDPGVALEIKLAPSGKVTGRVFDADGKPMPGVSVQLVEVSQGRMEKLGAISLHAHVMTTKTDDQGNYTLKGLVIPDGSANLQIEAGPDLSGVGVSVRSHGHLLTELKSGETLSGLNFRLRNSARGVDINAERE